MKQAYAKDIKTSYLDITTNKVYETMQEMSEATNTPKNIISKDINGIHQRFTKIYKHEGVIIPDKVYRYSKVHNVEMALDNNMWFIPNKGE